MNLRKKLKILGIVWIVGGITLGLLSSYVAEYFTILLYILFIAGGIFSLTLRCPHCGKPALKNKTKLFGSEMTMWTCWIPKNCSKCGNELE